MMEDEHQLKTDRDLLIELYADMKWVKSIITKHLAHHTALFYTSLATIGSLICGLVFLIIKN